MKKYILSPAELKQIQDLEIGAMCELDRICRKYNLKYTLAGGTLLGALRHDGFIPWDDDMDVNMLRSDFLKLREIAPKELRQRYFYQSSQTDPEYLYFFDKIRINDTTFKEAVLADKKIHHGVYIDIFPVDDILDANSQQAQDQLKEFKHWRSGLMGKYLDIKNRPVSVQLKQALLKLLYLPYSTKELLARAEKTIQKYNNRQLTTVRCFCGTDVDKEVLLKSNYENIVEHDFAGHKFFIPQNADALLRQKYGDYLKLPPKDQQKTQHDLVALDLGDKDE